MLAIGLRFGILSGIILSVLMLIPIFTWSRDTYVAYGEITGYISIILSLLCIYFGVKNYRDQNLSGKIRFGEALKAGLIITLIASLLFGIFTVFLYAFISPELAEEFVASYIQKIQNSGAPQDEINRKIAELEQSKDYYNNPFIQGIIMFVTEFPIGAVMSLFFSSILKNKKCDGRCSPELTTFITGFFFS